MRELDDCDLEPVAAGADKVNDSFGRFNTAADAQTQAARTFQAETVALSRKAGDVLDKASALFGGSK